MILNNSSEIKRIKRRFTGYYITTIALLVIIFLAIFKYAPKFLQESGVPLELEFPVEHQLLIQDGILHARLHQLQQLDRTFAIMIIDSSQKGQVDTVNSLINIAEARFLKTIDSIENDNKNKTANSDELMRDVTGSFRDELENRRVLANMRMALGRGSVIGGNQQMLPQSQNELVAKQKKIESLENELKTWQLNMYNNNKHDGAGELLKQDNVALQSAYKEQDKKIISLNVAANALKQENERLKSQVNDIKKVADGNDNTIKEKNTAMEKQVNALNAELRLSQVDCNLSRVDAQQIISNSKQRKVLLSDALNLLNGLAKTDDATVQFKVKEKIAKLKQITATIRD